MKRQILIGLFLLTVCYVGNIFSQIVSTSDEVIFKKLNFGFCSQGQQDDFPSLNHDAKLLFEIFKSISSKDGTIEVAGRAKQIIFSDTKIKIKNFRNIVSLIDNSIDKSFSQTKCTKETEVTLFLHQID